MTRSRPVTIPQFYRLIPLNCLELERDGGAEPIQWATAFPLIAAAASTPAAPKPKERVATPAQLYRLNQLGYLKLVPTGEGRPIPFSTADALLAETAARGLWTPRHPRDREPVG